MADISQRILNAIGHQNYQPLKVKALARHVGIPQPEYEQFRRALKELIRDGRAELGKNRTVRAVQEHGTVIGTYQKKNRSRFGYVLPDPVEENYKQDIRIRSDDALNAANGDRVLVRITRHPRNPDRNPTGILVKILERASHRFVGTYFERDGDMLVRVDGDVFTRSVTIANAQEKGVKPDDKVVIEVITFPLPEERGEGVIVEILGPRGSAGVDTLSIIREFQLPDVFPEDVLAEAREVAQNFRETDLQGREDLTADLIITIDPATAKDHDDAVSLTKDPKSGHWNLGIHIADVSHFVPAGSLLDIEARKRATSVYLPQNVIPMFPEALSNNVASLKEGKVRYAKSVFIDYTPEGQRTTVSFHNSAIRVKKRFAYEEVMAILEKPEFATDLDPEILALLMRMRDLALILKERRQKRGALELNLPEAELEYDDQGRVNGAHFRVHDLSHQIIEEFMLAANEAVAEHLIDLNVAFLRRIHPSPVPKKLRDFGEFARALGYEVGKHVDQFTIQKILAEAENRRDRFAINYAMLRSMKQAVYSPEEEDHYALATETYCHFTSPIRRYPDLTIHRMIQQWLKEGRAGSDVRELITLGEHCSTMERRAEKAEREILKVKMLEFLSQRIGMEYNAIITGVADYGFFAQSQKLPVEGRVHVSTLGNDYYYHDDVGHCLIGERRGKQYRLGDPVRVKVVRVDLQRRQMDLCVVEKKKKDKKARRNNNRRPKKKRRT